MGPEGTVFAQTAPGNAVSLRALLSAGFRPIGSEVLFVAGQPAARLSAARGDRGSG